MFIFCFSTAWLFGQDVRVSLKASKTEVAVGEQFSIVLSANIKGSGNVSLPREIEVLSQMSGKSSSSINGKQNFEVTQTLTVIATRKGTFNIPAVVWTYGSNKTAKSNTLKIVVKAGVDSSTGAEIGDVNEIKDRHFAIFSTSKKQVYVGEPFVITGKIYFDGQIVDANSYKPYESDLMLHKMDLKAGNGRPEIAGEEYGGKIYETILVFEELIVAQQSGTINFDAFSLNVGYQTGFFSKAFKNVVSNALQIKVLPLPQGAPAGFNGEVGNFSVRTSSDIQGNLMVGDVFTYKVHIEGSGNLHMLKPLVLNLPKGLILYGEPKVDNQVLTTRKGANGHIDYEFIVQVQEVGSYDFSPIEFAYFDPEKGEYETVNIPKVTFDALGDGHSTQDADNQGLSENESSSSWLKTILLALLILLLIVIGGIYFLRKNRKAEVQKSILKPKVDARAIALKSLDVVPGTSVSESADALEKIILQYFRDLTQDEALLLDKSWFSEEAQKFNISPDLAANWSNHFDKIQAIKYAGFGGESVEVLVTKTRELVG